MKYIVCGCNSGTFGDDPYNKKPKVFNTKEEAKKYLEDVLSVADLNTEMDSGFNEDGDELVIYLNDIDSCSVYKIFELDI